MMRRLLPLILVGAFVLGSVWFLNGRGTVATSEDRPITFSVGQIVALPSPDNPIQSHRLTVLQATDWGDYMVVDADGDLFSCQGNISNQTCAYANQHCPAGVTWAARVPGIGSNALGMCGAVVTMKSAPPAGWVTVPSCAPGQRLWATQRANVIVGYECR